MTILSRKALFTITLIALLMLAAVPVQAQWVNQSVRIDPGETVHDASSLDGSSETADVGGVEGVLSLADAVRFSGDRS